MSENTALRSIARSGQVRLARGPMALFGCAWRYRQLFLRLTGREVENQFRGSLLGKLWAAIVPLFMLSMYTFVFGVVLQVRWPGEENHLKVALLYFVGLIFFNFLFECINRAPTLMLENVAYIKKVIFPLEILPWVIVGAGLVRAAVSAVILFAFYLVIDGWPPPSVAVIPLLVIPLVLVTSGLTWFLSALGVYLRDIRQAMAVVAPATMFLSPIFFPLADVPEPFRSLLYVNPLTFVIDSARAALFLGVWPSWIGLALYFGVAWVVAWGGYAWFMSVRRGFADVL
jgi:lipopolysaccharide transport system permease protein